MGNIKLNMPQLQQLKKKKKNNFLKHLHHLEWSSRGNWFEQKHLSLKHKQENDNKQWQNRKYNILYLKVNTKN